VTRSKRQTTSRQEIRVASTSPDKGILERGCGETAEVLIKEAKKKRLMVGYHGSAVGPSLGSKTREALLPGTSTLRKNGIRVVVAQLPLQRKQDATENNPEEKGGKEEDFPVKEKEKEDVSISRGGAGQGRKAHFGTTDVLRGVLENKGRGPEIKKGSEKALSISGGKKRR